MSMMISFCSYKQDKYSGIKFYSLFYILLRFVTAKVLTKMKQNGAALPLRFAL